MAKDIIDIIKKSHVEPMEYNILVRNDKDKVRLIKRIEKHIRSSMEYKDYISFLRQNVGMDACAFFNNINKESSKSVRIEIHHLPYTLYDIVKIVLQKYEKEGIPLNDLFIAEEVMELHYRNMVGLIPLSKTLHLMIHGNNKEKLIIPSYMVFGNYKQFIEEYSPYMEEDDFYKVEEMIQKTKEIKENTYDFLKAKYDYLEVDGFTILKSIEKEENENEKVA